jgi:hypothetical protein
LNKPYCAVVKCSYQQFNHFARNNSIHPACSQVHEGFATCALLAFALALNAEAKNEDKPEKPPKEKDNKGQFIPSQIIGTNSMYFIVVPQELRPSCNTSWLHCPLSYGECHHCSSIRLPSSWRLSPFLVQPYQSSDCDQLYVPLAAEASVVHATFEPRSQVRMCW